MLREWRNGCLEAFWGVGERKVVRGMGGVKGPLRKRCRHNTEWGTGILKDLSKIRHKTTTRG